MTGESAIRLRGVVKRFGALTAVDGLDLDVPYGTCVGLLGPNGAGKSTTMKALTAQVIADEGELEVLGYRLPDDSKQARALMGVVPQLDNLDVSLTVEQNLLVFAHLYRVPAGRRKEAIERTLDLANLTERRDSKVDELSGGMRRRLLIARSLLHEPRLLLLDEPTVGLDPQVRQELWALIDRLRSEGVSILMSTHYIEEAERLCDEVTIMSHGKAVAVGPPRELIAEYAGPRRSRSTARRRGSPRSRSWPVSAAGARAAPARRCRSCRPTAPPPSSRASRADQPRGRLRPADREGDQLMAVATATAPRRRLHRLEWPALMGVMVREVVNYSSFWKSSTFSSTVDPTIYLLAFGFGFGSLVSEVAGYDYIEFVGTGIVATTVLFSGAFPAMYSTYVKYAFQRTYDAILAAPVDTEELVTAEAMWIAARTGVYGCVPMLVAMVFGLDPAWGMLLVPFIAALAGFGWAVFGIFIAAKAKAIESFSYWQSGLLTPMFLVAGTFFPLDGLPQWAQFLGHINPLYHCVELVRHAVFGFRAGSTCGTSASSSASRSSPGGLRSTTWSAS